MIKNNDGELACSNQGKSKHRHVKSEMDKKVGSLLLRVRVNRGAG